jgi:uncharacterized membrane protein YeaQ/YmgE (transglycosylase-associated protein family)
MLAVIADGITIRIGDHIWSFGPNVILYIVVAAIVGAIAEAIVGSHIPFGIIGATVAGLIGIWLMTQVIEISGVSISVNGQNDVYLWGVPIIRALIGAMLFVALWHLVTYGLWRRRPFRQPA